MNEFEWRRQMRDLQEPIQPSRDLWAGIESTLDERVRGQGTFGNAPPVRRRGWLLAAGVAASMALVTSIGWHSMHAVNHRAPATVASENSRWKPTDPRLSGAAIELDAARMELQLAIQQSPDSPALQRLLSRTRQQQNQLRELARQPG